MQRYFAINKNLDLELTDIHHIFKVMRMKPGDKIEIVFDKSIHLCQISELDVNHVKYDIIEKKKLDNEEPITITIAISLVNEQKWDYILQKSTELGVSDIIPLTLDRSLIKIDKNKYDKKRERWIKICKEASEQSHRVTIPNITDVMNVKNLIETEYDLKLVCSTEKNITNLKQILSNKEICGRILVVIGPEGGITPKEEETLVQNGFTRVSLGNNVLRVETAPLFVLSAINYELMR